MWGRIKAACLHSLTIAWTYLQVLIAAAILEADRVIGAVAIALGDPDLREHIVPMLPPEWAGYLMATVALVTFLTRLRSIVVR